MDLEKAYLQGRLTRCHTLTVRISDMAQRQQQPREGRKMEPNVLRILREGKLRRHTLTCFGVISYADGNYSRLSDSIYPSHI